MGGVAVFTWVPWSMRSCLHRGLASTTQKAVALGGAGVPELGDYLGGDIYLPLASLSRKLKPMGPLVP